MKKTTKILIQHNDTYWIRVMGGVGFTRLRILLGTTLKAYNDERLHVKRKSVVALQGEKAT